LEMATVITQGKLLGSIFSYSSISRSRTWVSEVFASSKQRCLSESRPPGATVKRVTEKTIP
jgi:hypothetical protein